MSDVEDAHLYDDDAVHNEEEEDSDEEDRGTSQKNVRGQEYENEEDEEEDEDEEDEDDDDPGRKRKKAKVSDIDNFEARNLYKNNSSIVIDVLLRAVSSILKPKSVMTMR